jgi:hypothetical protein
MLPYSFIGSWTYTNAATPVAQNIPMTAKPDWVFVKDLTNWVRSQPPPIRSIPNGLARWRKVPI